jgi:hypothetical protein
MYKPQDVALSHTRASVHLCPASTLRRHYLNSGGLGHSQCCIFASPVNNNYFIHTGHLTQGFYRHTQRGSFV